MAADHTPTNAARKTQGLSQYLRDARDRDPKVAQAAKVQVYHYLENQFQAFVQAQANRDWDNGLRPSDLFHSVFARMLDKDLPYQNTDELRAAFCRMVFNRSTDHLRRRARQVAGLSSVDTLAAREDRPGPYSDVEWLCEAVHALEADQPDLATLLRLRFVTDFRIRPAGGDLAFTASEDPGSTVRTFREMAEFLGLPLATVHQKYQEAIQWLRRHYPERNVGDDHSGR